MSLGFLVGMLLCSVGFAAFFLVLARAGALAKSKQIGAIGRILSGKAGPRERTLLLGAIVLCLLGACLLFMAVGRMDQAMRNECDVACREWGSQGGRIGRSRTSVQPLRACFCGPGEDAHQLYEINGNGQPNGPSTPPPTR
jgi:hypothetical protein